MLCFDIYLCLSFGQMGGSSAVTLLIKGLWAWEALSLSLAAVFANVLAQE